MMHKLVCLIILTSILLIIPSVQASEIILKSAQVVVGDILQRADDHVKIDFEGVTLTTMACPLR